MKTYTKEQILKAAELGEVSMTDANHIVSLLEEVQLSEGLEQSIKNKIEVIIDMAINFEYETYDRDCIDQLYNLLVPRSEQKDSEYLHPPYTGERGELYEILWKHASGGGGDESRIPTDEIDNVITDILKLYSLKSDLNSEPKKGFDIAELKEHLQNTPLEELKKEWKEINELFPSNVSDQSKGQGIDAEEIQSKMLQIIVDYHRRTDYIIDNAVKDMYTLFKEYASLPVNSKIPTDEDIENFYSKSPDNPIHPDRYREQGAKAMRDGKILPNK